MASKMLYVLPVLFMVQKIDFTDPNNVLTAQLIFGVAQGIVLLVCAYIFLQIRNRNDQTRITVLPTPAPFGGATGAPQQLTIREYDISQLRKFVQQIILGMGIAVFLFIQWNIVPPMAIQCVLNPVNLFGNPLFKLFVLGASPAKYPRPFPEENPLGGLFPAQQPAAPVADNNATTETAAIEDKEPKKKESKKKD